MEHKYKIKEVAESLFHIYEPAGVCSTLIIGNSSALLVDTGYGFENYPDIIRKITPLPLQIINTHGHLDHAGGNYRFDEPAFIHPFEIEVYDWAQKDKKSHLDFIDDKIIKGKIAYPFPSDFNRDCYCEYKNVQFKPVSDHQIFDLGARTVEVIFFPGHTKGSLAVYDHKSATLIAGDNLGKSLWIMFERSASLEEFEKSLAWIKENYLISRVLSSHDQEPYPPQIIDNILHAVRTCSKDTSELFVHPRHKYKALHHKEKVLDIPGLNTIHLVHPFSKR